MNKKILIATGGSGGHLFPAQQLGISLKEKAEVLFAGHGLDKSPFFDRTHHVFREIPAAPLNKRLIQFFLTTTRGVLQSIRFIQAEKPDLIVGFGGFHTVPLLLAALALRKKLVLFEANRHLGKVNRLFSPFAQVAMQFADPSKRIVLTPLLPWKTKVFVDQTRARENYYGLQGHRPTLLVFGGSQGALFLNRSIPFAIPPNIQVIHFTGKEEWVEETALAYHQRQISAVVKPFEPQMEQAYAAADGAICRSGASTVAELIGYGVPALLIPYPYAGEHQHHNAEFLTHRIKGASLLLQRDVHLLSERIHHLLTHHIYMREALLRFAKECETRPSFAEQLLNSV